MNPVIVAAIINAVALIGVAWIVNRVRGDVKKIEVATNSMKDALVLKTEEEALLRGRANQKSDDAEAARDK